MLVVLLGGTSAHAENYLWTNINSGYWSDSANWSPTGVPSSTDTAMLTNKLSINNIVVSITNNQNVSVQYLTMNNTGGGRENHLVLTNGVSISLSVANDTVLGSMSTLGIRQDTASGGTTTVSLSNLTLTTSSSALNLGYKGDANNDLAASRTNWVTVSGTFKNVLNSGITLLGRSVLSFTQNQAVTNNGKITLSGGKANYLTGIRVGGTNALVNLGSVTFDTKATDINGSFVATFVNKGTVTMTGQRPSEEILITVKSGEAVTNASGGSWQLISGGGNNMDVVVTNGGFVNQGLLVSTNSGTALGGGKIRLSSGQAFLNAASGQLIAEISTNKMNQFTIAADGIVNAGTNIVNTGAAMIYQTRSSGAGSFVTNTATGVMKILGGSMVAGTLINEGVVVFKGGTLAASTNGSLMMGSGIVKVQDNGVILDTGAYAVTNLIPLAEDPASTGGGLTKLGSGTLVLAGVNTYTGATAVSNGMLLVNGSISNCTVFVNTGATFSGTGILNWSPGQTITVNGTTDISQLNLTVPASVPYGDWTVVDYQSGTLVGTAFASVSELGPNLKLVYDTTAKKIILIRLKGTLIRFL
jgi:autotransporter-associated beta strand protein